MAPSDLYGSPDLIFRQNPDIELHWQGWVSTPRRLQETGWDLSIRDRSHPKYEARTIELAIRHPSGQVYGISDVTDFDMMRYLGRQQQAMIRDMPIQMRMSLGQSIQIATMSQVEAFAGFEPFDARPDIAIAREVHSMEDVRVFRTLPKGTPEITLDQLNIDEILELALKRQAPIKKRYARHRYEQELLTPATQPSAIIQLAI